MHEQQRLSPHEPQWRVKIVWEQVGDFEARWHSQWDFQLGKCANADAMSGGRGKRFSNIRQHATTPQQSRYSNHGQHTTSEFLYCFIEDPTLGTHIYCLQSGAAGLKV